MQKHYFFNLWLFSCHFLTSKKHVYCSKLSYCSCTNIIQLVDKIVKLELKMDWHCVTLVLLLTVFRMKSYVFEKLKLYGFSDNTILWFRSYLAGTSQYVEVNGETSLRKAVPLGVFQGSVAGPLLFIIYFNYFVVLEDQGCSVLMIITMQWGLVPHQNLPLMEDWSLIKNYL